MARDLTSAVQTELQQAALRRAWLVEIGWSGSTTYWWTGTGDLSWNGQTWLGAGHVLAVEPAGETGLVRALGARVVITGVPGPNVSLALGNARHGKPLRIYLALFDANEAVIADPALAFSGRVNSMEIEEDGDTATISIGAESRLVDLHRPRERRYTPEDQRRDYPSDAGFDYVPTIQQWTGQWGRESIESGARWARRLAKSTSEAGVRFSQGGGR